MTASADEPVEVLRTPGPKASRELSLVLSAVGIPHRVARRPDGLALLVPEEHAERAAYELDRYVRENRNWPPVEEPFRPLAEGTSGALAWAIVLLAYFALERTNTFAGDWLETGAARSAAIRAGQTWRCLTALTLHADFGHVASNAVFGAFFGALLAQTIGHGRTWFGAVLAGGLGNLINALLHGPDHSSIGASTAVFGLLGMLMSSEFLRRRRGRHGPWRVLGPLLGGGVLLGWLGMSGANTDVTAHAAGLLSGLVLGAVAELTWRGRELPRAWDVALSLAAVLAPIAAWLVAFAATG